jgi:prepilin-type N-terminal cleavage/methylation domain-containing protein
MKRSPSKSSARRRRSGVSLVEMLVVMTVAGVMMGLAITTIHLLLGAEHEATKSVRYAASVSRLARAFRDDIHAAGEVEVPPAEPGKPVTLIASTAGGQIRYELESHLATRVETTGDGEANRDVFYFPPGSRLQVAREEPGLIRLTVEMPLGPPAATPKDADSVAPSMRRLTIEAAPARVRRLEARGQEGSKGGE